MARKKYQTEEERKAVKKEYFRQRYENNKESIKAKRREHYYNNKEKILEQQSDYRKKHKEEKSEYDMKRYQNNRDEILTQQSEYQKTPIGRANILVGSYRRNDRKHNRGECTITKEWIVDNIFSQPCHYCGETDWHKLGCDRIDNDLPHTPENVVPCCWECNNKKHTTPYEEFIKTHFVGKIL